jgi:DNA-binding transcriptional LysR family regulator
LLRRRQGFAAKQSNIMDLMQLEMFVATVEEGNFRRAADRVYRTQPAVSMALKKLQEEVGAPLFERSGRSTSTPSAAGQILYEYAKKMLHLREEATNTLARLTAGEANRIRIGASDIAALHILPSLIVGFRQQYPDARIEVFHQASSRLFHGLKEHSLDLALMSCRPEDRDLEATPLTRDELVLVIPRGHTLASKTRVGASELAKESFIINSEEPLWHEAFVRKLLSQQVHVHAGIEATNLESIKKLVVMGLGISVMPSIAVSEEIKRGDLVPVRLEGFHQEHTTWAVSRIADSSRLEIRTTRRLIDSATQKLNRSTASSFDEPASSPLPANP